MAPMLSLEAVLAEGPAAAGAFGAVSAACAAGVSSKALPTLVAAAARGAVQGASALAGAGDGGGCVGDGGSLLGHLEEALHVLGRAAGCDTKPTVAAAKELLRLKGPQGSRLASRLGKLSKARNVAGHPDVSLIDDVRTLFGGAPQLVATTEETMMDELVQKQATEEKPIDPGVDGVHDANMQKGELYRQALADIETKLQRIERQLECLSAKLEQKQDTTAVGDKQARVDSKTVSAANDAKTSEAEAGESTTSEATETNSDTKLQCIDRQLECLSAKLEQMQDTKGVGEKQAQVDSETASAASDAKTSEAEACESTTSEAMETNIDPEGQEISGTDDQLEDRIRELLQELRSTMGSAEYTMFLQKVNTTSQRAMLEDLMHAISMRAPSKASRRRKGRQREP